MNVAEDFRAAHQELLKAIQGLTPEQMTKENVFGKWSAREVILHIAMWIGETLKAVAVWKTGHEYDWDYAREYLAYNDFWVSATKHLTLDQIMQMLNLYCFALYGELSPISKDIWQTRGVPSWLNEIAIAHTKEHTYKLKEYRAQLIK